MLSRWNTVRVLGGLAGITAEYLQGDWRFLLTFLGPDPSQEGRAGFGVPRELEGGSEGGTEEYGPFGATQGGRPPQLRPLPPPRAPELLEKTKLLPIRVQGYLSHNVCECANHLVLAVAAESQPTILFAVDPYSGRVTDATPRDVVVPSYRHLTMVQRDVGVLLLALEDPEPIPRGQAQRRSPVRSPGRSPGRSPTRYALDPRAHMHSRSRPSPACFSLDIWAREAQRLPPLPADHHYRLVHCFTGMDSSLHAVARFQAPNSDRWNYVWLLLRKVGQPKMDHVTYARAWEAHPLGGKGSLSSGIQSLRKGSNLIDARSSRLLQGLFLLATSKTKKVLISEAEEPKGGSQTSSEAQRTMSVSRPFLTGSMTDTVTMDPTETSQWVHTEGDTGDRGDESPNSSSSSAEGSLGADGLVDEEVIGQRAPERRSTSQPEAHTPVRRVEPGDWSVVSRLRRASVTSQGPERHMLPGETTVTARAAGTASAPALPKQVTSSTPASTPVSTAVSTPASQDLGASQEPGTPPGRSRPAKPSKSTNQANQAKLYRRPGPPAPPRQRKVKQQVCALALYELGGPDPRCRVYKISALPDFPKALILPSDDWLYVVNGADRAQVVTLRISDLPSPVRAFLTSVVTAEREKRASPADYRNQYRPLPAQRLPGQRSPERSSRMSLDLLIESSGPPEDWSAV